MLITFDNYASDCDNKYLDNYGDILISTYGNNGIDDFIDNYRNTLIAMLIITLRYE